MEKVRPWCGQPSDRGRLRNRTEQSLCDIRTFNTNNEIERNTIQRGGMIELNKLKTVFNWGKEN